MGWITIWRATVPKYLDADQWARDLAERLTHQASFQIRGSNHGTEDFRRGWVD